MPLRLRSSALLLLAALPIASSHITAGAPREAPLSAGAGTLYLGSYARRIAILDEATEKLTAEIPLKNGLPWTMRLSADKTRFYVQNADLEHFEVADIAARQIVDTFTLSEGNRHVRVMAFDADPQNRTMALVGATATKLADRYEIGSPVIVQYDLKEHKIVRTAKWESEVEPQFYDVDTRFSPDGKLLYVFAHEILIYDTATLRKIDTWNLSLPNEPGLGRFDPGSADDTYDRPGELTGVFGVEDPVQKRRMLVIGRLNLGARTIDFFPVGPAPEHGEVSFALTPDRTRAFLLLEEIGHFELWTVDIPARRIHSRIKFDGRTRMAIRSSSNGKIIYIYEAGNTIDLYDATGFKFLRTISLDADMMYGTFHVVAARPPARTPSSPDR